MVVERQPFSLASRIAAWLLSGICVTAGVVGTVLGIERTNVALAAGAAGALALGLFYAVAAWRGRPWPWR